MSDIYDSFKDDANRVSAKLDEFLKASSTGDTHVIQQLPMDELIEMMSLDSHIQQGGLHGDSLDEFLTTYLEQCTRLHHPGFLAQQVAPSHPSGALGSLIDGVTNNAMAIYEMGPAASSLEYFMLNWMISKVGWKTVPASKQLDQDSDHAGGTLTHGGSLGNLTALLAARSATIPEAWDKGVPSNVVVLVPEQSHYSLKRTVGILGIGASNCMAIPADTAGKVRPTGLKQQIESLQAQGKKVMAVVANGCGTAVGLYDPISEIADICEEYGIWLHVDAAHGGMALVSDKFRYLFDGVERADSIVWDAHKMMMTPTVCAGVLVKDHRYLDHAFKTEASYLIHEKEQPGFDFLLRNVECTKAGLGLRFFMSIASQGEQQLVNYYNTTVDLTLKTADWINRQNDMRLAVMPETNILCFQLLSPNDNSMSDEKFEQRLFKIRTEILSEGNFYISTTAYQGQRWLRLVVMSSNTQWQHIQQLMADLRRLNT